MIGYMYPVRVSLPPADLAAAAEQAYIRAFRAVQTQLTPVYHYYMNRLVPPGLRRAKPAVTSMLVAAGGHAVRMGGRRPAVIFLRRGMPVYVLATPRAFARLLGEGVIP